MFGFANHAKRRRSPSGKKKTRKPKLIDTIQVPLSNKFNILSEDETETESVEASTSRKRSKISPIVVTDIEADTTKITEDLGLSVETKIVSIGKKIFAQSAADKTKIITALGAANVNYFTHPDKVEKVFKAVLKGLPEIDTSIIARSLKETYNIDATKIIMFNTKSHSKVYLCHFAASEVNLKVLNTIQAVYHHIVKWQPFKPKENAPTQCYRCVMYGHGASFCVRYAVCMLCSGDHLTKECKVIKADAKEPIFKCFNCLSNKLEHNHKANDINCPFRAKYIATRANARNKNNRNPRKQSLTNNNSKESQVHRYVRAPTPHRMPYSFAAVAAQTPASTSNTLNNSNKPTPTSSNLNDSNIWTIAEVSQILINSINELKQCKSKLDQLTIIAQLLQNACN